MKKVLCLSMAVLMLTIVSFQSFAQAVNGFRVRLDKGKEVMIKTTGVVTSNSIGNVFAVVDEDVFAIADVGGFSNSMTGVPQYVLIKKGTPVVLSGSIEKSAIGKPGKITLTGATTTAIDGQTIVLDCVMIVMGKGKNGIAEIPAGTMIPNTKVAADYDIVLTNNSLPLGRFIPLDSQKK